MAGVAESAVLVSSAGAAEAITKLKRVQGPSSDFHNPQHVLSFYPSLGFQATHFGRACHIAEVMLRRQAPSKVYLIQDGKFVLMPRDNGNGNGSNEGEDKTEMETEGRQKRLHSRDDHVYPNLFLGITANLLGTGCREAVRFLVQEGVVPNPTALSREEVPPPPEDASEDQLMFARLKKEYCDIYGTSALADEAVPPFRSFLCCVVVSGGGVEHDVRCACAPYRVTHYASEEAAPAAPASRRLKKRTSASASELERTSSTNAHFGNVSYPSQGTAESAVFDAVMKLFAQRLCARQQRLRAAAAAKPPPEKYLDVCSWSVTPSEVWALLGLWLVDIMTEALHTLQHQTSDNGDGGETTKETSAENAANAEAAPHAGAHRCASCRAAALHKARTTVVYWAAVQQVPLYSPSFVDGDITSYLVTAQPCTSDTTTEEPLQLDLVRDIHSINKLAMQSKKTGMLICGGGVVKHHICNANLMRNGADYTIILNNGQEFDGSDAGAKPEEALSWGKVRMEGEFVKVYGEVTTYLPLLVAQVFVPAARRRNRQHPASASVARSRQEADDEHRGTNANPTRKRGRRRGARRSRHEEEAEAPSSSTTPALLAEGEKVEDA
ncbi:putative deoxyhypusine synthase [Leptomonas pyrrhocoris]|uniref:Putative deoxyhypusine synthase n=1 Tax=Leptomonas pyrrhocoris TaxID=157538 RepID=A0A0N0VFW2_LEPPY|nr:putative deoxyhypusine synthase [Leptomonas pyrrhocoris]KPA82021.1 putative deoxyhypusine synthase [Leptomonas pyrrhocoris]|eukprot:XP_015660460.1 putative deoxyhypusine synthase [Leptomonas pyrrhocoris]